MQVPSRLKETPVMGSECAGIVLTQFPVRGSQSLTFSSKPPETRRFAEALNATAKTNEVWPRSSTRGIPVGASQIRMFLSSLAEATYRESLDQSRSFMPEAWPLKVEGDEPEEEVTSQSFIVLSELPVATNARLWIYFV